MLKGAQCLGNVFEMEIKVSSVAVPGHYVAGVCGANAYILHLKLILHLNLTSISSPLWHTANFWHVGKL